MTKWRTRVNMTKWRTGVNMTKWQTRVNMTKWRTRVNMRWRSAISCCVMCIMCNLYFIQCFTPNSLAMCKSRMQYLAQVSQPRGRHFYQKCHISNPGGTILTKNVIFPTQGAGFWSNMSYLVFTSLQPRGHNFNQKCHIANTCGMILAKFIIKYILNT